MSPSLEKLGFIAVDGCLQDTNESEGSVVLSPEGALDLNEKYPSKLVSSPNFSAGNPVEVRTKLPRQKQESDNSQAFIVVRGNPKTNLVPLLVNFKLTNWFDRIGK